MNPQLETTFLAAIEQNQQKLLRVCSVYAVDDDDKKDLFQESLIHILLLPGLVGDLRISIRFFTRPVRPLHK